MFLRHSIFPFSTLSFERIAEEVGSCAKMFHDLTMGPNRRTQERERAAARAAAEAKRAEAERKAIADAQKIVAKGNSR